MPFLVFKTNEPISRAQEIELKERIGCAISHVPGKSEQGLLVAFEDGARIWLAGDDAPAVYVEASVFANEGHAGYGALSRDIAVACRDVLGISPDRVYVSYSDIPIWSVADMVADRRMFG